MTEPTPAKPKGNGCLLTLAAFAFVPVFGFFFGAVAAMWGLLSDRRRAILAAAIGGVGALLNLAGIMVWSSITGDARKQRTEVVARQLQDVVVALERYHVESGTYPGSLAELRRQRGIRHLIVTKDGSAGLFKPRIDFVYHLAPDGKSYDLLSMGPDQRYGTADDILPALSDSLKRSSGYRHQ